MKDKKLLIIILAVLAIPIFIVVLFLGSFIVNLLSGIVGSIFG